MQRRFWGAWLVIGMVMLLPMCEADDHETSGSGDGGEAGGDSVGGQPGTSGSRPSPLDGGTGGAPEALGGSSPARPTGAGAASGGMDTTGASGAGGLGDYHGPRSCQADEDDIDCCKVGDVSCDSLPSDWCSYGEGGSNPGPSAESCCDNGQRQLCMVVQGETGPEAFPAHQQCTCASKICGCHSL
jgi:hypothetical protein